MSTPPRSGDLATTATEVGRTPSADATVPQTPSAKHAPATGVAARRLAHFRLERTLGKGGMGEVWLATDLALERPVAIKLLSRELSADPQLRERFYREARAQARILHPNVGHIYYIGEEDGQLFFAMEYIEGESVSDLLARRGKLPLAEALAICRQAALGLREAHRLGFTHRDIKPSNLMLDRHGVVKVVDFGLVKQAEGENVSLTSAGGVMGTPLYIAPEQARGDAVDHRSDIYALGCTLHHLVAGEPPFSGDTALKVVSRHLADPRPALPTRRQHPAVDQLLDRMMAKAPADRFASYDDLIAAMEQAAPDGERAAGFFVRFAAMAIDVMLLGFVLGFLDGVGVTGAILPVRVDGNHQVAVALPLVLALSHWRFGRTIGKWLLEIEVVPEARSGRLGGRQALVRALVELAPPGAGLTLTNALAPMGDDLVGRPLELALLVAAIVLMVSPLLAGALAVRRTDRRTVWDRVAGTRVRYRQRRK